MTNQPRLLLTALLLTASGLDAQATLSSWTVSLVAANSFGNVVSCANTPTPSVQATPCATLKAVSNVAGPAPGVNGSACSRVVEAVATLTVGPGPRQVDFSYALTGLLDDDAPGELCLVAASVTLNGTTILDYSPYPAGQTTHCLAPGCPAFPVVSANNVTRCLAPGIYTVAARLGTYVLDHALVLGQNTKADFSTGANGLTVCVTDQGVCQFGQVIVPLGQNFQNTGTSTTAWRTTLSHFQVVYDSSLFTGAGINGPMSITRLRFRGDDGEANLGGQVYTGVTIKMSSCPLDQASLLSTFAANEGLDVATVYAGNVTVGPSSGSVPNDYFIDLTLATPFAYDPTLGLDLNIDVDAPAAPAPNATSLIATGTSNLAAHLARQLSTDIAGSPTGALSSAAAICRIDFVGGGGYADPRGARVASYGVGCPRTASSFYETFGADGFDLANSGLTLTPFGPDNYLVIAGAGPIRPTASVVASTGDDDSVVRSLPFSFVHPGNPGGTTVVSICTNGYVWLGNNALADYTPTVPELHGQMARLCPLWHDWHAGLNTVSHPGSGLYFDIDSSTPSDLVALVTWRDVGEYNSVTATGGHSVSHFQCAIHQNGVVEFRYGAMGGGDSGLKIAGFARGIVSGINATDPGSRDLSAEIPFTTSGPDGSRLPLQLTVNARPVLGTTITFTTSNIPATAVLSAHVLSFGQLSPGVDLGPLGAAGCKQSVVLGPSSNVLLIGGPSATRTFAIPLVSAYIGAPLFSQSVSFDATANPFGAITSNGLALLVGLQ